MKKRPIRRRLYRNDNFPPPPPVEEKSDKLGGTVHQLRHELLGLRAENELLRPIKAELAQLRASFAETLLRNSEKEGVI